MSPLGVPWRPRSLVLGFQNSTHFRTAADVAELAARGQQVSQLTYNERNRLGCG